MIPLRVLGLRVLIKPDVIDNAPETLASGIVVAKSLAAAVTGSDPTRSVQRGTVVAVGTPRHPRAQEATEHADWLTTTIEGFAIARGYSVAPTAQLLRDLTGITPSCAVGDDVLYAYDAGQEITLDADTYVLLKDAELLAIVEPEPCQTT